MTDGFLPYLFGALTAWCLIQLARHAGAVRGGEEEEEEVTYQYMTLSTYWDDMTDLLNKAAETGWEAFEVFPPGDEEDLDGTYRILLRKETLNSP